MDEGGGKSTGEREEDDTVADGTVRRESKAGGARGGEGGASSAMGDAEREGRADG